MSKNDKPFARGCLKDFIKGSGPLYIFFFNTDWTGDLQFFLDIGHVILVRLKNQKISPF